MNLRTTALQSLAAAFLLLPGSALFAQQEEPEAEPSFEERLLEVVDLARASSEADHRYNVETLSCGEFAHLVDSESQDDRAVVSMLMVWAHGYQSGLEGLNFHARPIDFESLVSLTRAIIEECRRDPAELFHVAVTKVEEGV